MSSAAQWNKKKTVPNLTSRLKFDMPQSTQGTDMAIACPSEPFYGELELELIQTQMTQKPMLRAEVYARALRASQRGRKHNTSTPLYSKVETVHELILKPDLSRFCVCFCIEESAPLFSLYVYSGVRASSVSFLVQFILHLLAFYLSALQLG
jgi:hypothetical protein